MQETSLRYVQNNRETRVRGRRRWRTAEWMCPSIILIPLTAPFTVVHHSLTGDISCNRANYKHHSKVVFLLFFFFKKKTNLERHSEVKLWAAFHATAWPGELLEVNLASSHNTHTCYMRNMRRKVKILALDVQAYVRKKRKADFPRTPRRFERKVVKTDVASCKSKRLAPNKSLFKVRTVRALCPSFILLPIDQIHFMAES